MPPVPLKLRLFGEYKLYIHLFAQSEHVPLTAQPEHILLFAHPECRLHAQWPLGSGDDHQVARTKERVQVVRTKECERHDVIYIYIYIYIYD
jgi:hypothetical protein